MKFSSLYDERGPFKSDDNNNRIIIQYTYILIGEDMYVVVV